MSVVVAIKENNKIYIGADSQCTSGGTRRSLSNPNNYKIWEVQNAPNCIMGHVGNVRDANAVKIINDLVDELVMFKGEVDFEYVVGDIFPHILYQLEKMGYIKRTPVFDSLDSSFLFCYQDKLFLLNYDGSVIEIDDYIAIGSGKSQAIGSLLCTEGLDPINRIIKAIKASAANDIYVDYPIVVSDTLTCEFKVLYENDLKGDYYEDKKTTEDSNDR